MKKIISFSLFFMLLFSLPMTGLKGTNATAQAQQMIQIMGDGVRLRLSPSTNGKILTGKNRDSVCPIAIPLAMASGTAARTRTRRCTSAPTMRVLSIRGTLPPTRRCTFTPLTYWFEQVPAATIPISSGAMVNTYAWTMVTYCPTSAKLAMVSTKFALTEKPAGFLLNIPHSVKTQT